MWPFGKKNTPNKLGDRVWINKQRKYDSLIADAKQNIAEGKLVLLTYYFLNTGGYISKKIEESDINFTKIQDAGSATQGKINIVQANSFLSQSFVDKLSFGTNEIVILFAEHHPLFKTENEIIKGLDSLGKNTSYCFYMSFDEPVLERFGAERILNLLEKLGMNKDEMISHTMISSAIEGIQKKIETKVTSEMKANSMEEWFDKNLKSTDLH